MNDKAVTKKVAPIVQLRERLTSRASELKAALTDIPVDTFVRAVMTSAQINPEILECSWASVWLACLRACRDGLLPDGQEGAIVAFKSTAQWLPMYQGLLKRFRRSGQFKTIFAEIVREGEPFEYWIDEAGPHIRHVPGDDDAPMMKCYAIATTKEADKRRAMSRTTREDSPWNKWPDPMYRKTALRALAPMLPSSRDIMDEDDFEPEPETPTTTEPYFAPPTSIAAQSPVERAQTALDEFANDQQDSSAEPEGSSGGTGDGGTPQTTSAENQPAASNTATDKATRAEDLLQAYERGQKAKSTGAKPGAVPGEYRDQAHMREQIAWRAGYDGKAMPSFGQ
jgi:recombination protein RecT